jgi:hypothetical protein
MILLMIQLHRSLVVFGDGALMGMYRCQGGRHADLGSVEEESGEGL